MTPEAQVRFYKALYRAKCEQYDAVMKEVDLLLEDPPQRCWCGKISGLRGPYTLQRQGVVHSATAPCYER